MEAKAAVSHDSEPWGSLRFEYQPDLNCQVEALLRLLGAVEKGGTATPSEHGLDRDV